MVQNLVIHCAKDAKNFNGKSDINEICQNIFEFVRDDILNSEKSEYFKKTREMSDKILKVTCKTKNSEKISKIK